MSPQIKGAYTRMFDVGAACSSSGHTHRSANMRETNRVRERERDRDSDESQIIASCRGDETQDTKKGRQRARDIVTDYESPARRGM